MKNLFCATALALLLMTATFLAFNIQPVKGITITVPDDYPTIQGAINAASENDTIFVRNGTYYENVVVNKAVSLVGENAQNTVIDGGGLADVVMVGANGVNVSGFTLRNSGNYPNAGITLDQSNYCKITGNNITANNQYDVYLHYSFNNTISENNIENSVYGVYLASSFNTTVSGNNITANDDDGVHLFSSSDNTVSGNNVTENSGYGVYLQSSSFNTVSGNTITANNQDGVYLYRSSNNTVSESDITANNVNGVHLFSSFNNTVSENKITNDNSGVDLVSSSDNTISGNKITANAFCGVYLGLSFNNTFMGNNITNNGFGVYVYNSSSNKLFHNNFINNTQHVYFYPLSYPNLWDNGYPSGGNYWSDFTDVDLYSGPAQNMIGADGIWDHPYVIDANNQDNYPIVPEFPTVVILPLFMAISLLGLVLAKKRIRP